MVIRGRGWVVILGQARNDPVFTFYSTAMGHITGSMLWLTLLYIPLFVFPYLMYFPHLSAEVASMRSKVLRAFKYFFIIALLLLLLLF